MTWRPSTPIQVSPALRRAIERWSIAGAHQFMPPRVVAGGKAEQMRKRPRHPGYVTVFSQGGDDESPIEWLVDHRDYHFDSAGVLATFATEEEALAFAERWRATHPVPEGCDDE